MFDDVQETFAVVMAEFGINIPALARERGLVLGPIIDNELREQLMGIAIEAAPMPSLGLEVGHRIGLDRLGVFGYALMNSPTAEAALNLLLQYQRALLPHVSISLLPSGDNFALVCHAKHLSSRHERFTVESLFVTVRNCTESLFPGAASAQSYCFDYPAPSYEARYRELLGDHVEFSASNNAIIISPELLSREIEQADPVNEALYRQQCDELSSQLGDKSLTSARVQQILLRNRGEYLSAPEVAVQLNMSESSLRRKLRAEGSSFQQLLDNLRLHLAQQYLSKTRLSVAEVGRLIGFDDVANFRKAFIRWSGQAPSVWREKAMSLGESLNS
ncbi:AraC family transcriptional regulator [Pseudoteredinibacter isoporae]|uniref:AraC-like DNA-binding protein n=1 Tax=Pseudoteredinibacter isoporae TaxID=570281 RepID=A0A7X0JVK7_9GAMM|nr:AraC family transcriptional regulator [Pseudoteredinibacter isoporae]MBB6522599.1 AraC-like DNA-binding protein [Pseudoteredinibacter isoporae]NHO88129.1 AraC family transcriptional regulator [Pseudoteredinibacter isoporae]NIB23540.1 AraC family transcriptional regulator [Pseudoteredinibacter isoporae]